MKKITFIAAVITTLISAIIIITACTLVGISEIIKPFNALGFIIVFFIFGGIGTIIAGGFWSAYLDLLETEKTGVENIATSTVTFKVDYFKRDLNCYNVIYNESAEEKNKD